MREYLISVKGSLFGTVPNHADTVQTILQVLLALLCVCLCV